MKAYISRIHFPIHALGPGKRIGIWFQGCSLHCPGCVSADTWDKGQGETTVAEVIASIDRFLPKSDGITISGGEPFEQPEGLRTLLTALREVFAGDVLVYSGYEYENLRGLLSTMPGLIDALITGPFVSAKPQTLPWRGSDNQELHCLTDLGRARFSTGNDPKTANFKLLDIMLDEDSTLWMAGIPSRGDVDKLLSLLGDDGFQSSSTADRRA